MRSYFRTSREWYLETSSICWGSRNRWNLSPPGECLQHCKVCGFELPRSSSVSLTRHWDCVPLWGLWIGSGLWLPALRAWDGGERMNFNNKGEREIVSEQIFIKTALLSKLLLCHSSHRLLPNPLSFQTCLLRGFQQGGFMVLPMRSESWMTKHGLGLEPCSWRIPAWARYGSVGQGVGSVSGCSLVPQHSIWSVWSVLPSVYCYLRWFQ